MFKTYYYALIISSFIGIYTIREPMIIYDFPKTRPEIELTVKQPQAWKQVGWYPTYYKIVWSEKSSEYTIALTDLTWSDG